MDGIFGNKIIICCCHHIINFDQYSSHGNNKSDCNKSAISMRESMNISLACNLLGESKRRKSSQFPNCFSSQAGTLSKEKEPEKRHEGGNEACLTRDRRYEGWQVLQTDQTAGSQPEN